MVRAAHAALAGMTGIGLVAAVQLPQAVAQKPTRPPAGDEASLQTSPDESLPEFADEAPPGPDGDTGAQRLVSILGHDVTSRSGDQGRVIDVLIDLDGGSGAVVVEFGGFMGIGSRKVAVEWKALRFVREGERTSLIIDITREQIRDAPEYKPDEPPTVVRAEKAKPVKSDKPDED